MLRGVRYWRVSLNLIKRRTSTRTRCSQMPSGGRDVVHAAAALEAGIGAIVSVDVDFDGINGLTGIESLWQSVCRHGGSTKSSTARAE